MKDLYKTLGLTEDASSQAVKQAYRKLIVKAHPDKGGSNKEMIALNEAYAVLSDPAKRHDFDMRKKAFQDSDFKENADDIVFAGNLGAGDTRPYSEDFRREHETLVLQYKHTPLIPGSASNYLRAFASGMYSFKPQGMVNTIYSGVRNFIGSYVSSKQTNANENLHDIFTLIKAKEQYGEKTTPLKLSSTPLNPITAIQLFTEFLEGNYFGAY
jgi:hypothetical protein